MHQILLPRYFREELKQRIWGKDLSWEGLALGSPHKVLLSYHDGRVNGGKDKNAQATSKLTSVGYRLWL